MKVNRFLWVAVLGAILLASAAARPAEATPSGDAIRGDVPTSGIALGQLTVDMPPADVVGSLAIRGCNARTLAVVRGGALLTYVVGAPSFVNDAFPASMASGSFLVYACDGTRPAVAVATPLSPSSSTPGAAVTGPRAQLNFAASVSAADRATATSQIKALEDYWQREVGLTFEGLKIIVAQDFESELADTYATATRRTRAEAITNFNNNRWVAVAIPQSYPDGKPLVLSIATRWPSAPDETSAIWVIAHEYYHLVQDRLSDNQISDAPLWATEGSADYAAYRYIDSLTGNTTSLTARLRPAAALTTASISSLNQGCSTARRQSGECSPLDPYRVGSLAHAWLADRTTPAAPSEFWRKLRFATNWETAFQTTYGLSTTDFYRDFEAFRAESSPVIRGRITVNGTAPETGWRFFICRADGPTGQLCPGVSIQTDGRFEMAIAAATNYRLLYDDPGCDRGGYLAATADTLTPSLVSARSIALGVTAVTLPTINIQGVCATVIGRLEDSTGRGIPDVSVAACFVDRCMLFGGKTSATGAFSLSTTEGSAIVSVNAGKCVGWYYHPAGAVRSSAESQRVIFSAATSPTAITFRIPATANATCLG
ncbi:MAG: hypothetical protein EPO65_08620 [Dehalococcoidia bacterium]|nr:MAG: hypothetical protein EPO65_08620 [Dehalococcoidia bacterium]